MHGKRVGIQVVRQRWRCLECSKTFQQLLPEMDEKRNMTRRLVEYIQQRSLVRTFTEVADDVGVNEKTVRNVFREYVALLEEDREIEAPAWLGIDELFLIRKPRCIFTDVKRRAIVDLLAKRDKLSVSKWLTNLPGKKTVEVVTMDMWKPYRDAATALLPDARVVVDKFHVVRMANKCLDDTRKRLRADMTTADRRKLMRDRHIILKREKDLDAMDHVAMEVWTGLLPELYYAYQAKERFFGVYDAPDRKEGQERYDAWLGSLDMLTRVNFKELITAVENWKPEILNYFGTGATNAYTEAANGLAKIANRNGRGYSFEAIRAKIIYGPTVKRGKFGESVVDEEIFAELTRPFVETPQADAEKETEGGQ
jgi:transposase